MLPSVVDHKNEAEILSQDAEQRSGGVCLTLILLVTLNNPSIEAMGSLLSKPAEIIRWHWPGPLPNSRESH